MKLNVIYGTLLIGALALGACSTPKLASNQGNTDDDVYYSNAKAGDAPEYTPRQRAQDVYANDDYEDDYYYYGSYASRINRFGYISPFGYYNDLYYGYSPYASPFYGGYGYSPFYGGIGWGGGFGYGLGWGGYGYGLGGYYSPYSFWGTGWGGGFYGGGYGYGGGYPYWGTVTAYNGGNARPYRPAYPGGRPVSTNRSTRPIGYNGAYPANSSYPGRPVVNGVNGQRAAAAGRNGSYSRPERPTYNPGQTYSQPQRSSMPSSPPPSSSGSSGGGGGGGRSSGGGGRPARP